MDMENLENNVTHVENPKKVALVVIAVIVIVLGLGVGTFKLLTRNKTENPQNTAGTTTALYKVAKSASLGPYFTDSKGATLYTYSKDTPNTSNCTDQCAVTWPPYTAEAKSSSLPGKLGVITRSDGTLQYSWNRMPLYYYSGDKKPGDTTGNKAGGVWKVAQ
jgi:predicted lipoprotein with Yx(FWY)xxD motif